MAKPQLENGHTRIANEILEHLMKMHLSSNEWQVVLCIIRKTYGFSKKVDYIANFQIGQATGLGKTVVSRILRHLNDIHMISRKGKVVGFLKDWEQWGKLAEQPTLGLKLANELTNERLAVQSTELAEQLTELAEQPTKVSSSEDTQKKKETIQKKLYKRKIPEFIDKEVWESFLEMRKKKGATPTEYATTLLLKKLEELRNAGDDPNEVLKRSIMNSWKGIFPLDKKGGQGGAHKQSPRQIRPRNTYTPDDS